VPGSSTAKGRITVSYLAGIHDMAYIFSRVGGSVDSGVRQDWVGLGANVGAMAGKAVWYLKGQSGALKTALEKVGKSVLPTPTAIIDVTMITVVAIDLFNGFGSPDTGAKFTSGVDKYKNVDSKLELALPDSRDWSGEAADAYVAQVAVLRGLVAEMQKLDKQMQTLVAAQGDYVKWAHQSLAILGFALVAGQGVALVLYLIPILGPELSMLFQVVAALAAVTTVVTVETLTLSSSGNNSASVAQVAADYVSLGQRAELGGSFGTLQVTGADETKVGSFTAISDGLSSFSATPPLSALAAKAPDAVPSEARAMMTALEAPVTDAPAATPDTGVPVPDAANPDVPVTPAFTPPTMAQLTQMSAQMAKFSANLAQPLNVVNQTMGSVQQVVSMAQGQGGGAPAAAMTQTAAEVPAEPFREEPTSDEPGAAAEMGERAPMDAAMAASEQPATTTTDRATYEGTDAWRT
jgi:hypothetical protein